MWPLLKSLFAAELCRMVSSKTQGRQGEVSEADKIISRVSEGLGGMVGSLPQVVKETGSANPEIKETGSANPQMKIEIASFLAKVVPVCSVFTL